MNATPPAPPGGAGPRTKTPAGVWIGLGALAVLALLVVVALLFWRGKEGLTDSAAPPLQGRSGGGVVDESMRLAQINELNRYLESEIATVRNELGGMPDCAPGSVRRTPDGKLVLPPAATGQETDPATPPDKQKPVTPVSTPNLAQQLEQATALVLTDEGIGTGFFIADKLLITNRHVVEKAKNGLVYVASRSLGTARRGTVLRVTAQAKPGSPDFALVRLDDGTAPGKLDLSIVTEKLTPVVAAGYPGLIVMNDTGFRKLIQGDTSTAPDLNLTQGAIQSLQKSDAGLPLVIHTAAILQGNSGGPLTDTCGRAVGINTFIAVDEKQSGRVSYAQSTEALLDFLGSNGVTLNADSRPCPKGT